MKTIRIATLVLAAILIAASGFAFDGERKGFVLGFGAGYAPLIKGNFSDALSAFEDQDGTAAHIHIGYAWNNRNMLLFSAYAAGYEERIRIYHDGSAIGWNEIDLYQAFNGITYRHYFSSNPKSIFLTVGIGEEEWIPNEYFATRSGLGLLFGAGYEFGKWVEVEAGFALATNGDAGDADHLQMTLTFNGSFY